MSRSTLPVVSAPRNRAPRNGKADIRAAVDATVTPTTAPVTPIAPPVTPTPIIPLASKSGADIFTVLSDYAKHPHTAIIGAVLSASAGNVTRALTLLGTDSPLIPALHTGASVLTVLGKTAPAEFFNGTFKNAYGVRIGDLYASALGLSSLYRSESRTAVKDARNNARALIIK